MVGVAVTGSSFSNVRPEDHMKLAIVDDESVYRNHIAELINAVYGIENVSCYLYSDGSEIVKSFGNGFYPDAVFLDIEMKELDGMSTAKVIRKYSKDIPIIFLTSHTEMAMEGYEVDALRFLSKPVNKDKLLETLKELENKLKVEEKIILKKDGEEIIFGINELIYVEAANNSVRFVFKKDTVEMRMKFAQALGMVDELSKDFFKCHRSYYVNLAHVKKLGSADIAMDNGDVLPVARSSAADAKKMLFEYVRRAGR